MPPDFRAGGGRLTERWRRQVAPLATGIPLDFVMAWIDKESSGIPTTISKLDERGLFQVHPDERDEILKLTPEQFGLLTDPARQPEAIKIGMRLVRKYTAFAKQILAGVGVDWHGLDFWRFVKLHHGAFSFPKYTVEAFARVHGRGPRNWNEYRTWVLQTAAAQFDYVPTDKKFSAKLRSLANLIIANAEETARRSGIFPIPADTIAPFADVLRTFNLLI